MSGKSSKGDDKSDSKNTSKGLSEDEAWEAAARESVEQNLGGSDKPPKTLVANVPPKWTARVLSKASTLAQPHIDRYRAALRRKHFRLATDEEIAEHGMYATHHSDAEIWIAPAAIEDRLWLRDMAQKIQWDSDRPNSKKLSLEVAYRIAERELEKERAAVAKEREYDAEHPEAAGYLRQRKGQ